MRADTLTYICFDFLFNEWYQSVITMIVFCLWQIQISMTFGENMKVYHAVVI